MHTAILFSRLSIKTNLLKSFFTDSRARQRTESRMHRRHAWTNITITARRFRYTAWSAHSIAAGNRQQGMLFCAWLDVFSNCALRPHMEQACTLFRTDMFRSMHGTII